MLMSAPTSIDPRCAALREYLVLRHEGLSSEAAREASTYADAGMWALTDNWELAYRAVTTSTLLLDESFSAEREIIDLKKRRVQIQAIIDDVHNDATMPSDEKHAAQAAFLRHVSKLDEVQDRLRQVTHDASMRYAEHIATPRWATRRDQKLRDYRLAYQGKGPQYETLCERLADATVMIEILQSAPLTIDSTEYQRMNQTVVLLTNQLQKFTEATKTQAIKTEINEALGRFMDLMEELIAPDHPQLWDSVVREVIRRAGGLISGEVPQFSIAAPQEVEA